MESVSLTTEDWQFIASTLLVFQETPQIGRIVSAIESVIPKEKEEEKPKPVKKVIIGINDFSGWRQQAAEVLIKAGIKCGRFEGTGEVSKGISYGHDPSETLVIVGNTSDGSRLSTVRATTQTAQVLAEVKQLVALGVTKGEFMNEAYLKGSSHNNEGATYAKLYLSALAAIRAAGLNFRLYANIDATMSWVEEMPTEFWVKVQGYTIHPYGAQSWAWGLAGYLKCLEYAAKKGASVGYIASEYGVELDGTEQGNSNFPQFSVKTEVERQKVIASMYERLIADNTAGGCEGIYYYQSHDDSGKWGLMDGLTPRASLSTVASFND